MGPLDNLKNVSSAIEDINNERTEDGDDMQLIASGGYNDIWLVNRATGNADNYVLRKPKEDALLPDQIRNEVACLKFVRKNLPDIPVPQVYDFNFDDCADNVYIAEEFIDGERLSDAWKTYDEPTKLVLAREIAEVIVKLGETTFEGIGGLMLEGTLGPTVEGMKLFKGRVRSLSKPIFRRDVTHSPAGQVSLLGLLQHWPLRFNKRIRPGLL